MNEEDSRSFSASQIPRPTAGRLSIYLRHFEGLEGSGLETVSSEALGRELGANPAQIRKDLGHIGQFGLPGVGYRIGQLVRELRRILGTDRTWGMGLAGVGNLGQSLMQYRGFSKRGFIFRAAFDVRAELIGSRLGGCPIYSIEDLPRVVSELNIQVGIIAVPATLAQEVADRMVAAGISGLCNFAPVTLNLPPEVAYVSTDLAIQLEQLSLQLIGKKT